MRMHKEEAQMRKEDMAQVFMFTTPEKAWRQVINKWQRHSTRTNMVEQAEEYKEKT
jgi:hypothetical protein